MKTGWKFCNMPLRSSIMRGLLISFLLTILSFKATASNYYWVGGSGNWDQLSHWATTSGGTTLYTQIPTALDDVYFDANSFSAPGQAINMNVLTAFAHSMNWTGVINSPTFAGSSLLKLYGSLTLVPGMIMNFGGQISFEASTGVQPITLAGKSLGQVTFIGGSWTFQDTFSANSITMISGSINTNNQTVNIGNFTATVAAGKTLNMGSSIFNITGNWTNFASAFSFPINSGTSVINMLASASFQNINSTFYDINFTSATTGSSGHISSEQPGGSFHDVFFASMGYIAGPLTFHDVTITGNGTINGNNSFNNLTFLTGDTYVFESNTTQTINGSFTANGTCSVYKDIYASNGGTFATISHSAGTVTVSYLTLKDMVATGGASFIANNSIDLGHNQGWTFNSTAPRTLYWINNAGNWNDGNHWSLTSGGVPSGCQPTSVDSVFFDANSFSLAGQTVTINVTVAACKNMDWTGVLNTPTLSSSGSATLHIYGSLKLVSAMNMSPGSIYFESGTAPSTITLAGKSVGAVIFNGGVWTFQDTFSAGSVTMNSGNITTNNQAVNIGNFTANLAGGGKILNMGSSVFNVSGNWINDATAFLFTINSGSSVINMNGASPLFRNITATYYDVNFTSASGGGGSILTEQFGSFFHDVFFASSGYISGVHSFHNVVITGNGTINNNNSFNDLSFLNGDTYVFESNATQTINGVFTVNGSCSKYVDLHSSTSGTYATISHPAGTVTVSYLTLKDMRATGGASFVANNSLDLGHNLGWTINAPLSRTLYWINNSGNWNDGNHWSLTSGGASSGCQPTSLDSVFFDVNSFSLAGQTVTVNVSAAACKYMNWTGVLNVPTFTGIGSSTLHIYGSLKFVSAMNMNYINSIYFEPATAPSTITLAGKSLGGIFFNGGLWTFQDTFSANSMTINSGNITTNNQAVNIGGGGFTANLLGGGKILNMGSSVFNVSGNWQNFATAFLFTINSGTSVINMNGASPVFHNITATFYDVNFTSASGAGGSILTEQFGSFFHDVFFASNGYISGQHNFHNVVITGDGSINNNNSFNDLKFSAGHTYTIEYNTVQTINGTWTIRGTCTAYILLQSSASFGAATFTKASGTVTGFNIHMQRIHATGGANFIAYNSVDLGGNTGWNFMLLPPLLPPSTIIGPSTVCAGATGVVYHIAPVQGAISYTWTVPPGATITSGQDDTLIVVDFGTATSGNISVLSFNGCNYSSTGSLFAVIIAAQINPTVSLSAAPAGPICSGTTVTFTATASSNGTGIAGYNFKVNGISVQNGASNVYTSSTLSSGDIVTCEISITGGMCYLSTTAVSNPIVISISPLFTPTVSIAANPAGPICSGTSVSFTATSVTNGTGTLAYNFKVNGTSVQNGASNVYTSSTLSNGDLVTCDISITGGTCYSSTTASSNVITMSVTPLFTPTVLIVANPTGPVCNGTPVTFTATASTNGTGAVTYNFKVNGTSVQNGASNIYTTTTLANADNVTCSISISDGTCYSTTTAISNTITMIVTPLFTPTVSITANPTGPVCNGTPLTFTATVSTNGTGTITYNFKVNGTSVQNGASNIYTTTTLANADNVTCSISISDGTCYSSTTAISNTITMTVTPLFNPTVSISPNPAGSICSGTSVTFIATASTNGTGTITYNFKVNGTSVQNGASNIYTTTTLANTDNVTCSISVSGGTCYAATTAVSNTITMIVSPLFTPTVSISANPAGSICSGTSVTFTATASTNGTGTIAYNFKVNGVTVQNGASNTYTSTTLANGNNVTCSILISGGTCYSSPTAVSNNLSITVSPGSTPTVSIAASPTGSICSGTNIGFTATASNTGGGIVAYNFKVNGISAQNGSSNVYSATSLANGDNVSCTINITGGTCLASNTASSNTIVATILPKLTPSISVVASSTSACALTPVSFTATAINGGSGASYQWKVNGINVGTNNPVFTSSSLNNGDIISCTLTSSLFCVSNSTATSENIPINIIACTCIPTIPNAFTPNGDGIHDEWIISFGNCQSQIAVWVYNRYGSLIYHSDKYQNDWKGTYQAKACPDGTYYYVIKTSGPTQTEQVFKGNVTILR